MNLYNGLLTNGLGVGLPAHKTLITQFFHLFTAEITVITTPTVAPYGGSPPLPPGEIQNFYKPVNPSTFPEPLDPSIFNHPIIVDEPRIVKDLIKIRVKFNNVEIEKEFAVPKRRAKIIVNIINFVNSTKDRMSVRIKNLKELKNKLFARIMNIEKGRH